MLFKNVASQKIHVYAYDSTTGAAKTGDAANITAYVSLDGTANAIDDTNPAEVDATNMPGVYVFDLAQAETNCNSFALYAKSATANIRIEPIIGFTTGAANSLSVNTGTVANDAITAAAIANGAIDFATFAADCKTGAGLKANVESVTANAIDAAAIKAGAIDAATFAADVDAEIAAMVWNAATASYGGAGTYGGSVGEILIDTGTSGVVVAAASKTGYSLTATTGLGNQTANITGTVSGNATTAEIADVPTVAEFEARTLAAAAYATAANQVTIASYIDTEISALTTAVADLPTNAELTAAITALLTTQMTESYNADGTAPTVAQALFVIMQRLTEFAIASTTITVKKLDGSTTALTLTLDDATTPTSSTRAT